MAAQLEPQTEIGRYVVEQKVGQGSMGDVYKARDYRINRSVAVKILRLNKFKNEEARQQARNFFLREARIYGKLNYNHIASIYDMGIHQGSPYLVMEFIEGKDLKTIIADKIPYSTAKKIEILSYIGRALHYAHQRGVLHRDIKPANIMLLENDTPKITDFGIARVMEISGDRTLLEFQEDDAEILGTPHYMSPEHILATEYTCQSDIFSLGIVAYEWLTNGIRPFIATNIKSLLTTILGTKENHLYSYGTIDQELSAIISKALGKKCEERYLTAEDFADALEIYLNSLEMKGTENIPSMSPREKSKIIQRLKEKYVFFGDFTNEEVSTIFKLSQKKKFIPGEYIIREGTVGTKMFVIISGRVSIQNEINGQDIEIDQVGQGSCIGEMAIIDKLERSASVVALEPTIAIAINETVLRLSNPALCLKLYRNLAAMLSERLRANDSRLKELLASR
jgi:serine/threonine-protein kinase